MEDSGKGGWESWEEIREKERERERERERELLRRFGWSRL
jgi:hypothetical protein